MMDEILNSSSDSYYLVGEVNPKTEGKSRKLFAPNTTLHKAVCVLKHKLRNAIRRANTYHAQLETAVMIKNNLEHANMQLCAELR